jgi:hypothetical protein
MVKNTEDQSSAGGFRVLGALLPYLPSLLLRLGGSFLRLKCDAKKAGRTFQKELLRQGIDEGIAAELTEIYLEPSSIKQYMGLFR